MVVAMETRVFLIHSQTVGLVLFRLKAQKSQRLPDICAVEGSSAWTGFFGFYIVIRCHVLICVHRLDRLNHCTTCGQSNSLDINGLWFCRE